MKTFSIIAAIHKESRGIGLNGKLPWHLPEDLKRFKALTLNGTVIMGRKTWESLPKALPNRLNIVITKNPSMYTNVEGSVVFVDNIDSALQLAQSNIFVIGGEEIYKQTINRRDCTRLYLTLVNNVTSEFDTYFPEFMHNWTQVISSPETQFTEWIPIIHNEEEEREYLQKMEEMISKGAVSSNRTGINTIVKFGATFRFDLRNGKFPLQTTRRMWFRGIFEEFKWMLSGNTNANDLAAKGVNIWLPNSTREFLDSRGLHHYLPGDIGPTYGFNLRHYGAEYCGMGTSKYEGKGIDQLQNVINQLNNKTGGTADSRRIIIDLWDPRTVDQTALPPCMWSYTFWYNREANELNLHVNQRSSDFFIARNWNDAFAALLLICIAKIISASPGELVISVTNTHLYLTHLDQVKEQLKRKPYPFPNLTINKELKSINDILNLNFNEIKLNNYIAHDSIKAEFVV
jgi:dihydrofolate reductase/thymidylate synthase